MATKKRGAIHHGGDRRLEVAADLFSRLGTEAEKIFKKLIEVTEVSSREFRQGLEGLADRVRTGVHYEDVEREIRHVAEGLLDKARDLELIPIRHLSRDRIVRETKKNLEEIVDKIQSSDLFAKARSTAEQTKTQVLSLLSIPSQEDVIHLNRKITSLEKRVTHLTRRAA